MSINLYWNHEVCLPVELFPKELHDFIKKINSDKHNGKYKHICKLIFTGNIALITYKEQEDVLKYIHDSDAIKILLDMKNEPVILSNGDSFITINKLFDRLNNLNDKRYCPYDFTWKDFYNDKRRTESTWRTDWGA